MVCPHCGSEIADGLLSCPVCGKSLQLRKTPPVPAGVDLPLPVSPATAPEANYVPAAQPAAGDGAPAETVPAEAVAPQAVEAQPVVPQPVEAQPAIPQPVEPQPAIPQPVEVQPVIPQPAQPQPAVEQPTVVQPTVVQQPPVEGQTIPPAVNAVPTAVPAGDPQTAFVPGDYSAPAYAQPAQKSSPLGRILLAVAALAVVAVAVFGIGSTLGFFRPAPPSISNLDYPEGSADSAGNPTARAFFALNGEELQSLLADLGYTWEEDFVAYTSADGNNALGVGGEDYYNDLTPEEIRTLAANGEGQPVVFMSHVDCDRYASAADAYEQLIAGLGLKETIYESDFTVAILDGGERRNLAVFVPDDGESGLHALYVFNEEAVATGVLDEYIGDECGTTIDEAYEFLVEG